MYISGKKTVAAAATPEPLVVKSEAVGTRAAWLLIQNNTGSDVWLGDHTVVNDGSAGGIKLSTGDSRLYPYVAGMNPYRLWEHYIAVTADGDAVDYDCYVI